MLDACDISYAICCMTYTNHMLYYVIWAMSAFYIRVAICHFLYVTCYTSHLPICAVSHIYVYIRIQRKRERGIPYIRYHPSHII